MDNFKDVHVQPLIDKINNGSDDNPSQNYPTADNTDPGTELDEISKMVGNIEDKWNSIVGELEDVTKNDLNHKNEVEKLTKELERQKGLVTNAEQTASNANIEIEKIKNEIVAKDEAIKGNNVMIDEIRGKITTAEGNVASKDTEIKALEDTNKKLIESKSVMKAQLGQSDSDLSKMRARILDLKTRVGILDKAITDRKNTLPLPPVTRKQSTSSTMNGKQFLGVGGWRHAKSPGKRMSRGSRTSHKRSRGSRKRRRTSHRRSRYSKSIQSGGWTHQGSPGKSRKRKSRKGMKSGKSRKSRKSRKSMKSRRSRRGSRGSRGSRGQ